MMDTFGMKDMKCREMKKEVMKGRTIDYIGRGKTKSTKVTGNIAGNVFSSKPLAETTESLNGTNKKDSMKTMSM